MSTQRIEIDHDHVRKLMEQARRERAQAMDALLRSGLRRITHLLKSLVAAKAGLRSTAVHMPPA